MTKLVEITVGDTMWLGFRLADGTTRRLYPSHRPGDCRRPGQRMTAATKTK